MESYLNYSRVFEKDCRERFVDMRKLDIVVDMMFSKFLQPPLVRNTYGMLEPAGWWWKST